MELPTAGALKQAAQGTAKSTASSTIPLFEGRVPAKTDAAQKVEPAGNSGNLLLLGVGLLLLAGLVVFFVL
jgi:hypothetical protein